MMIDVIKLKKHDEERNKDYWVVYIVYGDVRIPVRALDREGSYDNSNLLKRIANTVEK